MISNRTLKVTLAFVAAMVTIAAPPVSGSAKKKPIFYQSRINGSALLKPPYGTKIDLALKLLLGK